MATAPVTVNANLNFNPASVRAAGNQVQSAFGNINLPSRAVNNFNNSLGRITGQASEFDKSINAATARVFAFGAAVSIINGISTAFKALISSTIEVEKRITEIGSIIGGTAEQLGQFKTAIFDVAKNTGQTFDTVANGAAELARQGLSAEETVKRLNSALILTRVSGLDAESSVSALTAAINGFTSAGLTAEQIVNKLIAVDTAFAVSAKDLAEAFSRAGSTAEDAGVSFDQLLGLITSVQQTTARGGAVIGNAFKSIFARLGRGTVIEDLKALGVEIDQSQNGVQKLQALATALANISDPTKANAIKELAGGVYQINIVSAALKDLSSETSVFGKASEIAGQASNEAFEKNAQLNQTLSSQINKLVQGLTELGSKIGELTLGPVIQNLLTGANKLLDILNKVFDPEEGNKLIQLFFKGIGAFIAGPGLVLVSAAFFKLFQVVSKFAAQGVRDLFKIGSEQERIKNIEGGIVALLQQDAKLRATLLSTSSTQAQKEQAVINAIKQQNTLLTQQQALVNSIAAAAARAGVGGFTPTGGFTNRRGRGRFAAGFQAEEAEAMMLGATSNVKAQYGKGTIDGKKFIKNDQEIEITNFDGGRDSAVIPLYGRGFASGFIPNFASRPIRPANKNPQQIGRMGDKALQDYTNTSNFKQLPEGDPSREAAKKRREEIDAQKKVSKKTLGSPDKPLKIQGNDYGFLIPSLNMRSRIEESMTGKQIDSWQGFKGINYTIAGSTIAGPQTKLDITEKEESSIAKEAMDSMIKTALSYSEKLTNPLMQGTVDETTIRNRLAREGGNKGAYGAVQGAAGAAFEAVITQGLGIEEKKVKDNNYFDVQNFTANPALAELFDINKTLASADFKVSASKGTISSFAKKILNNNIDTYKKQLQKGKARVATKTPKNFASGFVPNFAALNDAISREMEAGIPRDKIYIDQDDSLKSPFNEQGLMIANPYDEPKGGKQGIKRAKREGKNPKTYGKANYAKGFIPNYAVGAVGVGVASKLLPFLKTFGGFLKNTFSGLASLQLFSLIPQINFSAEAFKKTIVELGSDASGFSDALKEETALRQSFINDLEKEKSKDKPNESRVKDLEGLIKGSEEYSASLENDPLKTEKSALLLIEEATGLVSFLNGIGVFSNKDLENAGPRGEELAGESTLRKILQPFLKLSLGDLGRGLLYQGVGQGRQDRRDIKAQEEKIALAEQKLKIKAEAKEVRKEIDRVKDLFEQETFSFKFDVKNVRSQLERIIDDVAIGGRSTSVERAGNITELQKKVLRSSEDEFKSNPTVTSAERLGYAGFVNDESSRLDNLQFKRRDELIGQTSSDKFGDLFTQLSGNLNTSGSGSLLLEKEKATAALANAKTAAEGSPDNEDAQQRVEQLTSSLSEIDSKIASRRDTAADLTQEGEVQRIKLKKVQDATKALTIGGLDEESQKKALEDVFTNLEGLNLGDGGEGIKEEILEAAKEVSAERTKLFVDQEKTRLNNELESLEKQKAILDEFVSKFNASFRENIKGTRDTFNTITKNQTPVAQNAAALSAARIGTGESSDAQIISDRLNASNRVTEVFDGANFSGMVGAEDLATFRSNTTSQIVSGEKLTALEDINEIAAKNLRNSVENGKFGDEQKSAITQVGRSALLGENGKGVASDIANEAAKSGDAGLAARAQELQNVLADPEAGISQILEAVENLNIDESRLSEEVQTALQENIARALGVIGGVKSSVEGKATVDQSQDVSEKIRNFSASLTSLIGGIDSNIPETKFPEIVAKLEQNTDLLQAAIGGLTTQFTNLNTVSRGLEGSLEIFKTTVDDFKKSEDAQTGQNTEALEAMRKALEAVEAATKKLKPDNTKPSD